MIDFCNLVKIEMRKNHIKLKIALLCAKALSIREAIGFMRKMK